MMSGRKSSNLGPTAAGGLFSHQTPQSKGRGSFNPGSAMSSARRSSLGGASNRVAQEDRPISDPGYHKYCVNKLNDFLSENLGQQSLPPKFVLAPSSHDIRKVFEQLMGFIGLTLSKGPTWDQEIAGIMRSLGYKYPVAKKNLAVSTTSMHAKGQLFGLFDWLVDALTFGSRTSPTKVLFPSDENSEGLSEVEFFKLVLHMENPQEGLNELYGKVYGTDADFKALKATEKKLQQEVDDLEEEIKQFNEAEATLKNCVTGIQQQDEYNTGMQERIATYKATTASKLTEIEEMTNKLTQDLSHHEKKKEHLLRVLSEQRSVADLEVDIARIEDIKKEIQEVNKSIDDLRKIIQTVKLEGKQHEDKLLKLQSDFHTCLISLKEAVANPRLDPYVTRLKKCFSSSIFAELCDFLLKRASTLTTEESRDKRSKLVAFIQELKMEVLQQTVVLEGQVLNEHLNRLREFDAIIAENDRNIQSLNQEIEELNRKKAEQFALHEQEYTKACTDYKANQRHLSELDEKLGRSESELNEKIDRLQDIVNKQQQEFEKFKMEELQKFKAKVEAEKAAARNVTVLFHQKVKDLRTYNEELKIEVKRQKEKDEKVGRELAKYTEKLKKKAQMKENRN
jgi:SMC interacting uncharacterized protein involved in chromosome segregation